MMILEKKNLPKIQTSATKKRPLESSKGRWKHALQDQCGIIPPGGDDGPRGHDGGGNHPGAVRAASLH